MLFNIYVNDLFHAVKHSNITSFADDTTLYKIGKNYKSLFDNVNEDLQLLAKWYKDNNLILNTNKTNYILFRRKQNKYNDEYSLKINETVLKRKKSVLLLGMHIDETMTWDTHYNFLKKKLNSALFILKQLKYAISKTHLKMIYHALFESYLNYGCMLWTNTKRSNLSTIQKLQIKALKCMNHGKKTTFDKEKILDIHQLQILSLHKFMYRIHKHTISNNIQSFFTPNSTIHNYKTRQAKNSHIKKFQYQQTINSFLYKGPSSWNKLPREITHLSRTTFNSKVKQLLIKSLTNQ